MARGEELTDEQWAVIEPHLLELPGREDGRGRPWRENREVINGILWILRSGARWKDLPARFPPYQTCHRRWKVERLNDWLQNFRRIATRFDYHAENYLGFVHLGCIKILLRCYL
jgi:transposase